LAAFNSDKKFSPVGRWGGCIPPSPPPGSAPVCIASETTFCLVRDVLARNVFHKDMAFNKIGLIMARKIQILCFHSIYVGGEEMQKLVTYAAKSFQVLGALLPLPRTSDQGLCMPFNRVG